MENWREKLYNKYSTTKGRDIDIQKLAKQNYPYFDDLINKYLPKNKNIDILDVACGFGPLLKSLKKAGYKKIHGVDFSEEEINLAHKAGILEAEQADAFCYLKDKQEKYDVIFLMDILEHLTRPELFDIMSLIYSALKPGGEVIAQVPNGSGIFGMRIRYGDLTHENCYTPNSIKQVLNVFDFEHITIREVQPIRKGMKGLIRNTMWQIFALQHRLLLYFETGYRKQILTQNMLVKAKKPFTGT